MGSIDDIAKVVKDSAVVNFPQLVGTLEGDTLVPAYKWDEFFVPHLAKLVGIKRYRFSADMTGYVFVKKYSDSEEHQIKLLMDESWAPHTAVMPEEIAKPGLSLERQEYLYEKIREFCPDQEKDRLCPKPVNVCAEDDTPPPSPSRKRQRLCGICRQPGHTRRTCPEQEAA